LTSGVILATAVTLAAAAVLNQGCEPQPLDPGGGPGAGGSRSPLGAGGRTGMGGTINTLGIGGFAGGIGMQCGAVNTPARQLPPDILILLDASGSMNDDADNNVCSNGCGASSKWALATSAINAVVAETDGSIRWGLKFFADTDATCGVGNNVAVPVGPDNASVIASAIMGRTSANGGVATGSRTPTRAAQNAGAAYLRGLTDLNPRFLLLVTDGAPNCMPGNADSVADDSAGAVAAAAYAYASGIPTMVIGVSTGASPTDTTLSDLAVAGGYPRAGSPSYYPVSSAAELAAALHALIDVTPDCIFALPIAPAGGDYRFGIVVNGTEIPRDTTHVNGWDLTDASQTAIEIYGPICDAVKAGQVTSVQVVIKCSTI
jgi:hypothetical protein